MMIAAVLEVYQTMFLCAQKYSRPQLLRDINCSVTVFDQTNKELTSCFSQLGIKFLDRSCVEMLMEKAPTRSPASV